MSKDVILFDGSGGSTKGIGVYNSWKTLYDFGIKPNYISGVSVSCLLSVPFALGKFKELDLLLDTFDLKTIYSTPPTNSDGKISFSSIKNVLMGKSGLARMDNLEKVLRKLITEFDFENYKKGNYPTCIGMCVNYSDSSRLFFNCKKITYEQYIHYTMASASIPVYSEPIYFEGKILLDGGVRNHSIAFDLLKDLKVTKCYSVFSRPKNIGFEKFNVKGVMSILSKSIDIMQSEISKQTENWLIENAKDNDVALKIVYLPKVLISVFDTERNRLNELKKQSIIVTKKVINE